MKVGLGVVAAGGQGGKREGNCIEALLARPDLDRTAAAWDNVIGGSAW